MSVSVAMLLLGSGMFESPFLLPGVSEANAQDVATKSPTSDADKGYIVVTSTSQSVIESAIEDALSNGMDTIVDLQPISGKSDVSLSRSLLDKALSGVRHNVWIVGNPSDRVAFDGNSHQILSVNSNNYSSGSYDGTLSLFGLKFYDGKAQGGNGSNGGGGGLGAGGAIFVNQGRVIIEQSEFNSNKAIGGNSNYAAGGGTGENHGSGGPSDAGDGGAGGRFNNNSSFKPFSAGSGGTGGKSTAASGSSGSSGDWGSGGGGGGGGVGAGDGSGNEHGGNAGGGGAGGWGAGGAGGGGAGGDDDCCVANDGDPGRRGYAGDPGPRDYGIGGVGTDGGGAPDYDDGYEDHSWGYPAGWGGGGGGLGGAIFVRDGGACGSPSCDISISHDAHSGPNSGAKVGARVAIANTKFGSSNSVQAGKADSNGSGGNGKSKAANFFYESYYDRTTGSFSNPGNSEGSQGSVNVGTKGFDPSGWPELQLTLVNRNNQEITGVFEGERAYLKVSTVGGEAIDKDTRIYFYLNLNKIHPGAEPGTNPDSV